MKRKVWDITVKDNPNRVVVGENDEFYTTDTEAFLVFNLQDEDFHPQSAMITLENRNDGSLKSEEVEVTDGDIQWEMPERYIEHSGNWQAQLVYEQKKGGVPEKYTSGVMTFTVNSHIKDKKKPSLVEIENWEKFIAEGTESIETWEDMEALREENERQRQENYQELLDTGVLQTNINTKLEQLEEEYAPKLTEVTSQLAQNMTIINTKMDKGSPVTINQIDKASGKFDETYMSPTFLQQITGNAPVGTVPADNSLTPNMFSWEVNTNIYPRETKITITRGAGTTLNVNFLGASSAIYWTTPKFAEGYRNVILGEISYPLAHNGFLALNTSTKVVRTGVLGVDNLTKDEILLLLNIDGELKGKLLPYLYNERSVVYFRGKVSVENLSGVDRKLNLSNQSRIYFLQDRGSVDYSSIRLDEDGYEINHNEYLVLNIPKLEVSKKNITEVGSYNRDEVVLLLNIDGVFVSGAMLPAIYSSEISKISSPIKEKGIGRPIKINNIHTQTGAPNGAVVVGDEYWAFYASNDQHTNYGRCDRFKINEDLSFTFIDSFQHNWGHCNSLDYSEEIDTLILGNGSGDYSLSGMIFIIENIQSIKSNAQNSLTDVATIIDVGMEFGSKVNVVWGDCNGGNYDIAHVIANDNKDITRIQLMKSNDSFNGDYRILKKFNQKNGLEVVQGAVYGHDGYLYVGLGHDGAWYAKQGLNSDGSITVVSAKEDCYDLDEGMDSVFTQSVSMYQDKLFLRTSRNGGEVYVLYK